MHIRLLTSDDDLTRYEAWVRAHPHGSLWQSVSWKKFHEACGRETRVYVMDNGKLIMENEKPSASALVMIDRTTGGFSTWEVPRGPLWTNDEAARQLIERIVDDARKDRAIALYFSPSTSPPQLSIINYQLSIRHVHCSATRIIDLKKSEDEILAQMHPKGRYNINVAKRHGITVTEGSAEDMDAFYELLRSTSGRDGFTISQKSHYTRFLSNLEGSFILIAKHAYKPIAGLIGVKWGTTGIYYYGASSHGDRQLMAPYLLQWESMRKCKEMGCGRYDLLGIEPEKRQAESGKRKEDPWAGITEFKRKFGGTVITYPPERMIVLRPVVKKVLEWKRRIMG
ncbi:MAG: peptidoglycan bridge formation glycyltransferase FemA/FemB family protein [Candidatus Peribacteraceae bacterium]|nr:peptidoglycan bridge formation glycyltransferase FemA/FemB family protein [Candidatus Peribacteraceae bacterium]